MKTRTWFIIGGAIVLLAIGLGLWSHFADGVPVEVATVTSGRIEQYVDERATTRLPITHRITMPITGRLDEEPIAELTEGTPVEQGQVVARIVPRDTQLDVDLAQAAVDRLEASLKENSDVSVERTAKQQAERFVDSMDAVVKAAESRLRAGQAKLDYAERNLGRIRRLAGTNAATQDQLDRAVLQQTEAAVDYRQDQLVLAAMQAIQAATRLMPTMVQQYIDRKLERTADVLEKQKAEAQVRLEQQQQDQQRGTMTSPVDGVVLRREVTGERFLQAGTLLLEIGRLERLQVEADVLSVDVVDIKPGDQVEIYGPAIGLPRAKGTVARIYPAGFTKISSLGVEQQRVKVIIDFDEQDRRRLLDERHLEVGYRVRVRIITASADDTLLVPRSALFRGDNGQWQVYTVRAGVARLQTVELGLMNDQAAQVLDGLEPGDRVIRAPRNTLGDGVRVQTRAMSDPSSPIVPRSAWTT